MNEIIKRLNEYEFFLGKNIEIYNIQDYGRNSKFKVKINEKYYTLMLDEKKIALYIRKLNILGDNFKKIIGFCYLSDDNKILVLDYYGNNKGIDLVKIENSNYCIIDSHKYSIELKNIIDNFHSNKVDYIDFSDKNYNSWKEYYLDEIGSKIESIYNQKLIDDCTREKLVNKLNSSSKVYENFETSFIHADITPLNVCINTEKNNIYLIDYDDFKIGDPLMDISRIINCKDMSKVFKTLVDNYYYKYENNINHLFYTLRVNINWYNHIIEKKQENIYNLDKARENIYDVINKILEA